MERHLVWFLMFPLSVTLQSPVLPYSLCPFTISVGSLPHSKTFYLAFSHVQTFRNILFLSLSLILGLLPHLLLISTIVRCISWTISVCPNHFLHTLTTSFPLTSLSLSLPSFPKADTFPPSCSFCFTFLFVSLNTSPLPFPLHTLTHPSFPISTIVFSFARASTKLPSSISAPSSLSTNTRLFPCCRFFVIQIVPFPNVSSFPSLMIILSINILNITQLCHSSSRLQYSPTSLSHFIKTLHLKIFLP